MELENKVLEMRCLEVFYLSSKILMQFLRINRLQELTEYYEKRSQNNNNKFYCSQLKTVFANMLMRKSSS